MNSVPKNITDKLLTEFFEKDGGLTPSGNIRRSTLLACKRDFLFLRGAWLRSPEYGLTQNQINKVENNLPTFAAILVYCSAIDLIARVMKRNILKVRSKEYFLYSARKWFGHNKNQSLVLWNMRCAMSHQYHIEKKHTAVPHGFNGSMKYNFKTKKWIFNLNGLFGDIRKSIEKTYTYIKGKNLNTRNKYAKFIYENGFYYTQQQL